MKRNPKVMPNPELISLVEEREVILKEFWADGGLIVHEDLLRIIEWETNLDSFIQFIQSHELSNVQKLVKLGYLPVIMMQYDNHRDYVRLAHEIVSASLYMSQLQNSESLQLLERYIFRIAILNWEINRFPLKQ